MKALFRKPDTKTLAALTIIMSIWLGQRLSGSLKLSIQCTQTNPLEPISAPIIGGVLLSIPFWLLIGLHYYFREHSFAHVLTSGKTLFRKLFGALPPDKKYTNDEGHKHAWTLVPVLLCLLFVAIVSFNWGYERIDRVLGYKLDSYSYNQWCVAAEE